MSDVEREPEHNPASPAERKAFLDALAQVHRFTVCVSTSIPARVWGFAETQARRIVIPPDAFDSDLGLAGALHEAGHVLEGLCPRMAPHYRDPAMRDWHACIECERLAWVRAWRLAPEFTRPMFDELRRCLATYRRRTRAYPAATAAARTLASDGHYYGEKQAQLDHALRMERHAEMQRWDLEPHDTPEQRRRRAMQKDIEGI